MKRYFLLASIAVFFSAFGRWSWFVLGPPTWGPRIECEKAEIDAGECWVGDTLECDFTVRNSGSENLRLVAVQGECNCTSARASTDALPPDSLATIHVTVNAKGPEGHFRRQIMVATNDPRMPQLPLVITGLAKSNFSVKPRKVSIDRTATSNLPKIQLLSAHPLGELRDIAVAAEIPGIKATLDRTDDGKGYVVSLEWDGDASAVREFGIGYLQIETHVPVEPSIRIPISIGTAKAKIDQHNHSTQILGPESGMAVNGILSGQIGQMPP